MKLQRLLSPAIIACLFIFSACKLQYQNYRQLEQWEVADSVSDMFRNFQALQVSPVSVSMEGEQIRINLAIIDAPPRERSFKRIKRKLAPNAGLVAQNDSSLPRPNRLWMERVILSDSLFQYNIYFAYSLDTAIQFAKATFYRETQIRRVHQLLHYIAYHGIPSAIFEDISTANVNFLGRDITLESFCQWESAHRLQCPGRGRISWSLHPSAEDAIMAKQIQMEYSRNYEFSKLEEERTLTVIFEGVPMQAQRMIFSLKNGSLFRLNRDRLIVYYLAGSVRGQYVHAVLSFHEDEAPIGGVPSLIGEVLELPD